MSATLKGKLEKGKEYEGAHQLVKEFSRRVHQVALFRDARKYIEQLLSHKIAFIVRVKRIHAVLNDVGSELLVVLVIHAFYIRHGAKSHKKVRHALRQVQVIE